MKLNPDGTTAAGTAADCLSFLTTSSGYSCPICGCWVTSGTLHCCGNTATVPLSAWLCQRCGAWIYGGGMDHVCLGSTTVGTNVRQCERCGQWVFGGVYHVCSSSACRHCYCIDVPPSGERTRPHARCCKCQDVRLGKAVEV